MCPMLWRSSSHWSMNPSPAWIGWRRAMIKAESRVYFRALGKHIEVLRKGIGMTQAELARAIGVSQQTVYAYETGDRRVSVLILAKLAPILQVSVEELISMRKV